MSAYETQPDYQKTYAVPKANGMRAVPDVSYNADPASGYAVYKTTDSSKNGWYTVGGTSAGRPQWAAIYALGHSASLAAMYGDKASPAHSNSSATSRAAPTAPANIIATRGRRYDYVTGLGVPLTIHF